MLKELPRTWDEIADHWDDWGPPLRPCEDDVRLFRSAVGRWAAESGRRRVRAVMLGVTPELASARWPLPVEIEALDRSEDMIRKVWPGDVPGLRRARLSDWTDHGIQDGSVDAVLADGSFVFFDRDGCRALMDSVARAMVPDGILAVRHFTAPSPKDPIGKVLRDAKGGTVPNFHDLKWRMAASLQDGDRGVRQHDVWSAVVGSGLDFRSLPQPGFSEGAVSTIRFYERKDARLFFPTTEQFAELLMERFGQARYEFTSNGPRYPFFTARKTRG